MSSVFPLCSLKHIKLKGGGWALRSSACPVGRNDCTRVSSVVKDWWVVGRKPSLDNSITLK